MHYWSGLKGNEEHVFESWREGNPYYIIAKSLVELFFSVICFSYILEQNL